MKNALILHGTNASSKDNWFPWLKSQLEQRGWNVWVPDLPMSNQPSMSRYNKFLLSNKEWNFNSESVLIGHSSGAVAVLGVLQALPQDVVIDACIMVAAFKGDLGWENLTHLWDIPIDYKRIKKRSKRHVFVHSEDDPYCALDHAKELSKKLGGELIVQKGAKHFSLDPGGPRFKKLPIVLKILEKH